MPGTVTQESSGWLRHTARRARWPTSGRPKKATPRKDRVLENLRLTAPELRAQMEDEHGVQLATRNPFTMDVRLLPNELQEEFMELINDSTARDEFQTLSLTKLVKK